MPAPVNRLKQNLMAGQLQRGLWLAMSNAMTAEIAGRAGYDWCLIDGEHAPNSVVTIAEQARALAVTDTQTVVRVPEGTPRLIKQMLDLGIQSILVPMIDTAEEAEAMVAATRYPPRGIRGVGAAQARATGFGQITDYLDTADDQILLMVQVESRRALDNLEAICAVDGVDGVFVGPADLAADMGYLGQPGHSAVKEHVLGALRRIESASKIPGIVSFNPNELGDYAQAGARFLGVGGDVACLARAFAQLKSESAKAVTITP